MMSGLQPPRCGRPMRMYRLARSRDEAAVQSCGRPAGHPGQCLTAESYLRYLRRKKETKAYRHRLAQQREVAMP
jgi:hypothetical protein